MCNQDVRQLMATKRLRHYEVAMALGISEYTFCKWLRSEFEPKRKQKVLDAINEAAKAVGV